MSCIVEGILVELSYRSSSETRHRMQYALRIALPSEGTEEHLPIDQLPP